MNRYIEDSSQGKLCSLCNAYLFKINSTEQDFKRFVACRCLDSNKKEVKQDDKS